MSREYDLKAKTGGTHSISTIISIHSFRGDTGKSNLNCLFLPDRVSERPFPQDRPVPAR